MSVRMYNLCIVCVVIFTNIWSAGNVFFCNEVEKPPRTHKLSLDVERTYKCGGFRRYHCTYQLKFVKPSDSELCTCFQSGEHFHCSPDTAITGIPQHVKNALLEGVEQCTKPAKVYRKLAKSLPKPIYDNISLKQVQQAMGYIKKKHCGVLQQNTVGFLNEWLQKHELTVDSDMHTVGVLRGWKCNGTSSVEDSGADVHFVISTKRLLFNVVQQAACSFGEFLSIDGTYGLLDVGYPVIQVGTVDATHKYYHVAVAVSRHENTESFTQTLRSVKDSVECFFGYNMQPQCSVPDKAKAIYNALHSVFPPERHYHGITVAICYFHNKQAIEANKAKFTTEARREAFERDVEKLHAITSTAVFNTAVELFEKKWIRKELNATTWYMGEWGKTMFHAAATPVGAPVANCTTERSNKSMKDYVSNHERLAMGNFLGCLGEELGFQSQEADKYPLATALKNNRQTWGQAQLWIKTTKKFIRESTSAQTKCFYAPSSEFLELNSNPTLQQLRDAIWQCKHVEVAMEEKFDEYVQRMAQTYTLKPIQACNDENFFSCTCTDYWKTGACKHSLGLSISKDKVAVPPGYLVDSLEQLKKKGRPRKNTHFMKKT